MKLTKFYVFTKIKILRYSSIDFICTSTALILYYVSHVTFTEFIFTHSQTEIKSTTLKLIQSVEYFCGPQGKIKACYRIILEIAFVRIFPTMGKKETALKSTSNCLFPSAMSSHFLGSCCILNVCVKIFSPSVCERKLAQPVD